MLFKKSKFEEDDEKKRKERKKAKKKKKKNSHCSMAIPLFQHGMNEIVCTICDSSCSCVISHS
jgi:hypothetical protein